MWGHLIEQGAKNEHAHIGFLMLIRDGVNTALMYFDKNNCLPPCSDVCVLDLIVIKIIVNGMFIYFFNSLIWGECILRGLFFFLQN